VCSDSEFGRIKLETEEKKAEAQWVLLQDIWTLQTDRNTVTQVGLQSNGMAEENIQPRMAREAEKTSVDKMLELMMTIRMEHQKREQEREEKKRERKERQE